MILKKIICSFVAYGLLTVTAYADKNNLVYDNGVKDTQLVGSRYVKDIGLITGQNKDIVLNGYGVLLNVSSFSESKIIQASAIGLKNGLDIKYIKFNNSDYIVFTVEKREADAMFLIDRLSKYGISSSVEKLGGTYSQTILVAHDLISAINDSLTYLTARKDDKINKLSKLITSNKNIECPDVSTLVPPMPIKNANQDANTLDLSNLQVVNRVVTTDYLNKYKIKARDVKPHSNTQRKSLNSTKVNAQIKKVTSNIKNDAKNGLPEITSFAKAYKYLREHSAITNGNSLLLHKKIYKVGDALFKWNISSINYNLGVVVLGNDYTIPLKKNK